MIIQTNTIKAHFDSAENFDSIEVGFDKSSIAHFFRMVANLYTDPVTAVLRELGANCVDAIKEAGEEGIKAGWELHLPTRFCPTVKFIDNGVGISEDRMRSIYSVIGGSSKRGDAEQIGGFGVGRLSLFSLVNTCNVISRYNGVETRYFIHIQPNGLPDIKTISAVSTKKRNGVEVSFDVQEQHINDFNQKYLSVYHYFTHRPRIVLGNEPVANVPWVKEPESDVKGNDWTIRKGNSIIVMGGIQYALPQTMIESGKLAKFAAMTKYGVVIFDNIGEYSITPSREAIQFDDMTVARLYKRFDAILNSLVPLVEKKIAGATNLMEAKRMLRSIKSNMSFIGSLSVVVKGVTIDDKPIDTSWIGKRTNIIQALYKQRYYRKKVSREDTPHIIDINSESIVVLNDLKRGFVSRFTEFAAKNYTSHGSFVGYFIDPAAENEFRAQTKWFGAIPKASDVLPKIVSTSGRTSNSRSYLKSLFQYNGSRYGRSSEMVKEVDAKNLPVGCELIIFPIFNALCRDLNLRYFTERFATVMDAKQYYPIFAHKSVIDSIDTEEVSKELGRKAHKFDDWASKNYGKLIKASRIRIDLGHVLNALYTNRTNITTVFPASLSKGQKAKFISKGNGCYYAEPRVSRSDYVNIVNLLFGLKITQKSSNRMAKLVEQLYTASLVRFPLLKFIDWHSKVDKKELCDYINMVEAEKKAQKNP